MVSNGVINYSFLSDEAKGLIALHIGLNLSSINGSQTVMIGPDNAQFLDALSIETMSPQDLNDLRGRIANISEAKIAEYIPSTNAQIRTVDLIRQFTNPALSVSFGGGKSITGNAAFRLAIKDAVDATRELEISDYQGVSILRGAAEVAADGSSAVRGPELFAAETVIAFGQNYMDDDLLEAVRKAPVIKPVLDTRDRNEMIRYEYEAHVAENEEMDLGALSAPNPIVDLSPGATGRGDGGGERGK